MSGAERQRRRGFSLSRYYAILTKEFIQLGRDRLTFSMMVGLPILQLILFGYAINTDPKHMPTAVVMQEDSRFARSILAGMVSSEYFNIKARVATEADAENLFASGQVVFILNVPTHFARDLVRGDRPQILLEADASDPVAAGAAVGAFGQIVQSALRDDLKGSLGALNATEAPVDTVVHRRYNPEGLTQFNIVPGLLGVVLTMSMIMMTALSLTRETERGTMENLLAMPVTPLEVMFGKVTPYIGVGMVQVVLVLGAAHYLFGVPIVGSLFVLGIGIAIFIAAMLAVGYTFSTVAKSQMQAMQMSFFFFVPSIFLSGFMFPFYGMPHWAQILGDVIPLTYMLRILRGVILKGSTFIDLWPEFLAMIVQLLIVSAIALNRYRQTLD